jgi:hypothetical protein
MVISIRRPTTCRKGLHRMTAQNTYYHPGKGFECRACKRDYMRDYMRERRAEARRALRRSLKRAQKS